MAFFLSCVCGAARDVVEPANLPQWGEATQQQRSSGGGQQESSSFPVTQAATAALQEVQRAYNAPSQALSQASSQASSGLAAAAAAGVSSQPKPSCLSKRINEVSLIRMTPKAKERNSVDFDFREIAQFKRVSLSEFQPKEQETLHYETINLPDLQQKLREKRAKTITKYYFLDAFEEKMSWSREYGYIRERTSLTYLETGKILRRSASICHQVHLGNLLERILEENFPTKPLLRNIFIDSFYKIIEKWLDFCENKEHDWIGSFKKNPVDATRQIIEDFIEIFREEMITAPTLNLPFNSHQFAMIMGIELHISRTDQEAKRVLDSWKGESYTYQPEERVVYRLMERNLKIKENGKKTEFSELSKPDQVNAIYFFNDYVKDVWNDVTQKSFANRVNESDFHAMLDVIEDDFLMKIRSVQETIVELTLEAQDRFDPRE